MRKRENEGSLNIVFDSLDEYVDSCEALPFVAKDFMISGTNDFHGISWDEAIKAARSGWKQGIDGVICSLHRAPQTELKCSGTELTSDFSGPIFDMGELIAGNPECYLDFNNVSGSRDVIKMALQFNAAAFWEDAQFFNRGAIVLRALEMLNVLGHPVELWAVSSSVYNGRSGRYKGDTVSYEILLQRPDMPIDVDRIAFAACNKAMLRRLTFGHREAQNEKWCRVAAIDWSKSKLKTNEFDYIPFYTNATTEFKCVDKGVNDAVEKFRKIGIEITVQ